LSVATVNALDSAVAAISKSKSLIGSPIRLLVVPKSPDCGKVLRPGLGMAFFPSFPIFENSAPLSGLVEIRRAYYNQRVPPSPNQHRYPAPYDMVAKAGKLGLGFKNSYIFQAGVTTSAGSFGTNRSHFLRTLGAQRFSLRTQAQERTENAG